MFGRLLSLRLHVASYIHIYIYIVYTWAFLSIYYVGTRSLIVLCSTRVALLTRIGFGGIVYYIYNEEPPPPPNRTKVPHCRIACIIRVCRRSQGPIFSGIWLQSTPQAVLFRPESGNPWASSIAVLPHASIPQGVRPSVWV